MKFGSLFSGIGGLDLGLERAGMECAWQVEIDDYCTKVLTKHWPKVPKFRDIRDCGRHNLETVDLICGGFPCQPVSLAGRRQAQADPRWLWPEFARVVAEIRPIYVIVENVPGLYTAGGSEVLADLATLGYDAEWSCVSAAAFGAPHLRYRIFIVAYTNSVRGRGSQPNMEWKAIQHSKRSFREGSYPTELDTHRIDNLAEEMDYFSEWWSREPDVDRVAHGVPNWVDRLKGLGNAVVPQVAEWVGRRIMENE